MYRQIRTAVAAVAEERLAKRVTALLAAAGLDAASITQMMQEELGR